MPINNNSIFGAFTLGEVRSGRLTGEWLNKETVANYGWFGGGYTATVDRIDFSNDSTKAQSRGSLSQSRGALTATGNSNYGWFGGGYPIVATVDRINFSNDSSTASPRGSLSQARFRLTGAVSNSNYGWFGGGLISLSPTVAVSTVDRIDFSNDSPTTSVRGPLSGTKHSMVGAVANSNYGWFGGINISGNSTSFVDRIDFSNDFATASPRGYVLSAAAGYRGATGNSNYGWFGGGNASVNYYSTVDRIDFSNDLSTASVRGSLSQSRSSLTATGNSNYGWFGGGSPGATPAGLSTVDRIDFSNDSATASPRGLLFQARYGLAATSGVLNIRRQKAKSYGWYGGGLLGAPTPGNVSTVDRIDFSNDSVAAQSRGSLSAINRSLAATGNSNYGWFGGGSTPTTVATVDRINFSNDSVTASPRTPLSVARSGLAATGNSNYGWFGGGLAPGLRSTVDRINFSNDSVTASPRSPLSAARGYLAATGNSNYGWFGAGYTSGFPGSVATVDRIDFSNDTATTSVRGSLSSEKSSLAATGNSNYGWFGGGGVPGPILIATVDRIDFSNDSVTTSIRGPLSAARYRLAATGNSNYGWFGGGRTPGSPTPTATVDRIDFSNDSATASPRGSLFQARQLLAATSNTPIG